MEQLSIEMFIFLIAAGFIAAFVDSVVGGEGEGLSSSGPFIC
jgi:uncharacterized membrane protein